MKQRRGSRSPRPRRGVVRAGIFLLLGAIVNIAVAWGCFPGKPYSWDVVEENAGIDQSDLINRGLPSFDEVNSATLRSFGFLDRDYSTFVDPDTNEYAMLFARETRCGWPLLALQGIRWAPMTYSAELNRHVFTGDHHLITALYLSDEGERVLLGEREFLPYGPIWPGFALNTLFYAAILWLLFAAPFALRRWQRIKRGLCPACAYPVGASDLCTECGKPVRARSVEQASS